MSGPLPDSAVGVLSGRRTCRRENWPRILNRGYLQERDLGSELSSWTLFLSLALPWLLCVLSIFYHPYAPLLLTLALFPAPGLFTQVTAHTRPSRSILLLLSATQRSCVPIRRLALKGSRKKTLNPLAPYSENYV